MEASSPLAAMRPSSHSWGRKDIYTSHPAQLSSAGNFGPGSFNFRDLSMQCSKPRPSKNRPKSDYFALNGPVRGSSPTASLAADLSQNFHIDMSPQFPTPRRALFTSNLFGTLDVRENVTTPPLPSSSPGPINEMMDISPLPHKAPYQVEVDSPTPGQGSPSASMLPSSPPDGAIDRTEKHTHNAERKKPTLLRPSLARTKGFSTNTVPRQQAERPPPPFRFNVVDCNTQVDTNMTLGDCFSQSPPQERRPTSARSTTPPLMAGVRLPRLQQSFSNLNGTPSRIVAPAHNLRRTAGLNPLLRPKKQFRRSTSMFEGAGNADKKEATRSNLSSVMDIDEPFQPALPHFFQEGQPDSIPRISKETLLEVLDGKFNENFDQRMIIDCRFEYEFQGGHIDGAVNYNDKELLSSQLFETALPGKTLLILHCEYSAHRAPIMARYIRQKDRTVNVEHYPRLSYPEIYILDGGYSAFFSEHRDRCFPQNYVEMDSEEHAYTCEREMGRLRQNRAKLSRAQTYAFGEQQMQVEESPTASGRTTRLSSRNDDIMMESPPIFGDRTSTRRMVSY